jgi:cytochrome c oxidase subunit 1
MQSTPLSETMSSNLPHDFEGNEAAELIQEQWNKTNKITVNNTEEVK